MTTGQQGEIPHSTMKKRRWKKKKRFSRFQEAPKSHFDERVLSRKVSAHVQKFITGCTYTRGNGVEMAREKFKNKNKAKKKYQSHF